MKLFRRLFEPDNGAGGGGTGSGGGDGTANREGGAPAAGAGTGAAPGGGAPAGSQQGAQPNGGGAPAGGAAPGSGQAPGSGGAAPGGGGAQPPGGAGAGAADDPAARWNTDRTGWAKGDQAKLNWINRYASPQAALDAAWSAQERLAQTRPTTLPPNPTPEQVTEYRKANGIPEKPEGYWEAEGLKSVNFQDVDKEIVAPYLPIMHELNLRPDQVAKLISFRQAEADRMVDERVQGDAQLRQQTEDALRGEWGSQYRQNVGALQSLISTRFGDAAELVLNARTPDGTPLLGNQTVLRSLLQMAMDLNGGVPTITTTDGKALDGAGVDARMKEIEGLMRDPGSKYWKGPESNAIQAEYRTLIESKERNAARGGRAS